MLYYHVEIKYDTLSSDGRVFQRLGRSGYYYAESFSELLNTIDKEIVNCDGFKKVFHSVQIQEATEEEAKGKLCNWKKI